MELPLHVSQVLEEECAALGERPAGAEISWLLREDHFVAPLRLAVKLRDAGDPLSERLRRVALPDARELPAEPALRQLLVERLNAVLATPLYEPARFAHVDLGRHLKRLVRLRPQGDELIHLNRLLLERAYPGEIKPIHELRVAAVYRAIHELARRGEPRTALCLSGGGIRSATFALGIIQGLARLGLLTRFDYLSTVSGGGYIGSWLSAWIHRHPRGAAGVMDALRASAPRPPLQPEAAPIRHLRAYSNYLSPRLGLLSADTWSLVGTYVRNLLLNWLVLLPLLLAVLAVPRLAAAILRWSPGPAFQEAFLVIGLLGIVVTVSYMGLFRPSLEAYRQARGWFPREANGQMAFLVCCLLPLLVSAMSLTAYWTWVHPDGEGAIAPPNDVAALIETLRLRTLVQNLWTGFVVTGVVLHLLAWVTYSFWLRRFDVRELLVALGTGGLAGLLIWTGAQHLLPPMPGEGRVSGAWVCFAVPLFVAMFLLSAVVFIGLVSRWTDDEDREWWARAGAWMLIVVVAWSAGSVLVVFGPGWLGALGAIKISALGVLSAVASALGAWSSRTPATTGPRPPGIPAAVKKYGLTAAGAGAGAFLVVGLSATTNALLTLGYRVRGAGQGPEPPILDPSASVMLGALPHLWLFVGAMLAFGLVMSAFIHVNKFSLHAMYRNRLIRAYLGASRGSRNPNPFTGFDPADNVKMYELQPGLLDVDDLIDAADLVQALKEAGDARSRALAGALSRRTRRALRRHLAGSAPAPTLVSDLVDDLNMLLHADWFAGQPAFQGSVPPPAVAGQPVTARNRRLLPAAYPNAVAPPAPPARAPLHVVNIALNLVGGHDLAWQERKAESFTVTPLHSGSYHLGYRPTHEYGGREGGISLGTAITISGAAASPNMGYHSSRILAFLMTLLNIRLGWWLGNPGVYGQETYRRSHPGISIFPMLDEAFGLTDDTSRYVYLSDGGHFDDLGLLEMTLRRCHLIVVSDAAADRDCVFHDLGNAIRKIRVDLGVPITIDGMLRIFSRASGKPGKYCAVGTIDYQAVDGPDAVNGRLLYIKPCVYGGEPVDLFNYAEASKDFPHETTMDQWFTESQFESYRMLGLHTIAEIANGAWYDTDFGDFLKRVDDYLKPPTPASS
ncbi:MAG: patatin-like phospholipase family protein [Candidatus Rokubacteria bacterium]|nr:patatin-like phospholipase family protein [Candidatus Rokubacteria bacterium]